MAPNIALITGGASGMGLAVAKVLADKGWRCVLLDMNAKTGAEAVASVPNSEFIKVDVTSWESLSSAFDATFEKHGTVDFVFANAGIVERDNFYEKPAPETLKGRIPPRPNLLTIDVNLKAVIDTAYLAQHYFRLSPHHGKNACLIMTASVGGLVRYPNHQYRCIMYLPSANC
jgi:NAD(P)-dependent dehydrogenase (short-subunit alcohol dehydrogenase family)